MYKAKKNVSEKVIWRDVQNYPVIVDTAEFVKFLSGYHERSQVGSVDGKKHDCEHCPDICHEPRTISCDLKFIKKIRCISQAI